MESRSGTRLTGQVVVGVAIALLGVLFTLDNLHILRARDYLHFWPLAVIAIGLVHAAQARTAAGVVRGGIWILVGLALLGNRLGFLDVNIWSYWPLLLVLVGGRIVLQSIWREAPSQGPNATGTEVLSAIAIMGGFDRKITSHDFRGGEITAFMGGGKLDLRDAVPANGQAVVNVFALMGGFEILVPETWSVVSEVTPFMGSVEDKARTSNSAGAPRLVLRGFVMMSGVEIKNA
jgi:predicted membrane protein